MHTDPAIYTMTTGPSLDLRTAFRFGTWSVLSLGEQVCDLLVVRELPISVEKLLDANTQHPLYSNCTTGSPFYLNRMNPPLWNEGRNALRETSHAVLGLRGRKKHQWISDETLGTIDEHRTTRLCVATRSWHDIFLPNANNNYDEMRPPVLW